MSLSGADKKQLEQIHKLFLELEKSSKDGDFSGSLLTELKSYLAACATSTSEDIQKFSQISNHLKPSMTLKHFSAYLLPVERLLNKKLRDDDFLISTTDKKSSPCKPLPLIFVLDNIRSAFNVGSIFRTADGLHAEEIYLCGYTPTPEQEQVNKTALGTQKNVAWSFYDKTSEALQKLKQQGYKIIALETSEKAQELYAPLVAGPTALVLGNERYGLDAQVLNLVDEVRSIPLRGLKNSLNVGVTAAVAGFEWARQWNKSGTL